MRTTIHRTGRTTTAALGAALVLGLLSLGTAPIHADGGSSVPATPNLADMTPADEAIDHYNQGLKARDKAWELEEANAVSPSDKVAEKMHKQFEKAAASFEKAISLNPRFHQAHSSLGYALRRLGDYEASLAAYNRALELSPTYAEAIEYRAEAYLGLNRVEEAKAAYLELFRSDRERADELYEAMESWLADRKTDPAGLDLATVEGFSSWLEERGRVADTTAMLYRPDEHAW